MPFKTRLCFLLLTATAALWPSAAWAGSPGSSGDRARGAGERGRVHFRDESPGGRFQIRSGFGSRVWGDCRGDCELELPPGHFRVTVFDEEGSGWEFPLIRARAAEFTVEGAAEARLRGPRPLAAGLGLGLAAVGVAAEGWAILHQLACEDPASSPYSSRPSDSSCLVSQVSLPLGIAAAITGVLLANHYSHPALSLSPQAQGGAAADRGGASTGFALGAPRPWAVAPLDPGLSRAGLGGSSRPDPSGLPVAEQGSAAWGLGWGWVW